MKNTAIVASSTAIIKGRKQKYMYFRKSWRFHLMLLPAVLAALVFNYAPLPGIVMAFQNFKPWLGFAQSEWVGWDNFQMVFTMKDSIQVLWNTLLISCLKIIFGLAVPVAFALMLNEIRQIGLKRSIQTMVYLPHFMSWVILGGILLDVLSLQGIVNQALTFFQVEPIMFLGDGDWFRITVIVSDLWKEFGFSAIVFLAALSGINPEYYEASEIDGAGRWKQTLYITLPSMLPIMAVVFTLSLGNVLNANFDQIYNLINPLVLQQGDIIDTFVFRNFKGGQYSLAAAVGLFKSLVSFILISGGYYCAYRWTNYRVF
ncbi:ABC transporter permease [Cohnella lupini]|uniref:Putative aldouronate transport system permease protein n=1 Tax=Cohnella lupini TaxID=1294267 RepID=A0A3D9IQR2_9BACL|nr:ABC transporter permease subunit [Cohnella lupini]RED63859.1 putative aldouronate transport system permease protein [Cohnella lupini]